MNIHLPQITLICTYAYIKLFLAKYLQCRYEMQGIQNEAIKNKLRKQIIESTRQHIEDVEKSTVKYSANFQLISKKLDLLFIR